ncbi:restriction endonuclease [Campylobacter sp. MIT 99-7217]|uniref:restriction endonuclease n=1 Tax=Campylobacter sp. MIT 99-7217 TaxID=535091 RepID=UPI0011588474|nr:restriction endonuclease [Campylobacter sp. MIT 99-7217]TQR34597.1 restriction endonuclease [Campylobacter sp. MIT 99-7217]
MSKFFNDKYLESISVMASLSRLFSKNNTPFLHYRVMENLFCSCFNAKNLSRSDTAFDAQIGDLGVGLKTFICQKDSSIEKIAEFNKDSKNLQNISDEDLAFELARLRNDRIELANNIYGIKDSIYHIIARQDNKLLFFESDYDKIDISNIRDIKATKASISFKDSTNEYHFNRSKSVLQRKFHIPKKYFSINIEIIENPFDILLSLKDLILNANKAKKQVAGVDFVILPLYSTKGETKKVPLRSGLNQWNAGGRRRSYGEVYIPIPTFIHKHCPKFFPPRDIPFTLKTPNNEILNVKLCQDNSKALMSNPNTALSNWLLKTALNLQEKEVATYTHMQNLGFDSVIITKDSKDSSAEFSIDIMPLDSYENFIHSFTN